MTQVIRLVVHCLQGTPAGHSQAHGTLLRGQQASVRCSCTCRGRDEPCAGARCRGMMGGRLVSIGGCRPHLSSAAGVCRGLWMATRHVPVLRCAAAKHSEIALNTTVLPYSRHSIRGAGPRWARLTAPSTTSR